MLHQIRSIRVVVNVFIIPVKHTFNAVVIDVSVQLRSFFREEVLEQYASTKILKGTLGVALTVVKSGSTSESIGFNIQRVKRSEGSLHDIAGKGQGVSVVYQPIESASSIQHETVVHAILILKQGISRSHVFSISGSNANASALIVICVSKEIYFSLTNIEVHS